MSFTHLDLIEIIDNDRDAYENVHAVTIATLERLCDEQQASTLAEILEQPLLAWTSADNKAVGDAIQDYITAELPTGPSGGLLDGVISRLLSMIDWREIGKNYIESSVERWKEERAK